MIRWKSVTPGSNRGTVKMGEYGLFMKRLSAEVWIGTTKESQ